MSARRKARKRALDFLYEADMRKKGALELYTLRPADELSAGDYVAALLQGVAEHQEKIDDLIITYAQGWDLDRMPSIDRNLLRIALYEILYNDSVDDKIAVTEAVELAKELSTDESAGYINGVLGRIIALKPSLAL
ncbi:MAG: utilization substance protein [Actinomycetota bacterium]|jgi:N utilization substance protein B